jgi:hypothetical protein
VFFYFIALQFRDNHRSITGLTISEPSRINYTSNGLVSFLEKYLMAISQRDNLPDRTARVAPLVAITTLPCSGGKKRQKTAVFRISRNLTRTDHRQDFLADARLMPNISFVSVFRTQVMNAARMGEEQAQ